jgi:hypothetical protein
MRKLCAFLGIVTLVLTPFSARAAQGSIPPDIHAKMDGYVGSWTFEETNKETPSSPETTQTGTWEARWIFDGLIQWKGSWTNGGRTTTNVEFEGYDPLMQGYSYGFASDGSRGQAYDGEWDGTTLRLQFIAYGVDGTVTRGRCTWPYNADFTALPNYFCEQLTDGRWWVSRRGTATKVGG